MAVDQDSLNDLTTTSGPTGISAAPLSGGNPIARRLALLAYLWRLPLERLERTDTFPVVEPLV